MQTQMGVNVMLSVEMLAHICQRIEALGAMRAPEMAATIRRTFTTGSGEFLPLVLQNLFLHALVELLEMTCYHVAVDT